MRRALALFTVAAGCAPSLPDVCAEFSGRSCIGLEVRGDSNWLLDQVRVSGLSGFRTTPGNDAPSPEAPGPDFSLPVVLAVVPPAAFSGSFSLDVRAFSSGVEAMAGGADGFIVAGQHIRLTATVVAPPREPPIPILSAIDPPVSCVGKSFELSLEGSNFRVINGVAPTVALGNQRLPSSCPANQEICTTIRAQVPAASSPDSQRVWVINPPPFFGESSSKPFETLAAPLIDSFTFPQGKCSGGFRISGLGFYGVDGADPVVTIDGSDVSFVFTSSCSQTSFGTLTVETCQVIDVAESVGVGQHRVTVTGAAPLDCPSQTRTIQCF